MQFEISPSVKPEALERVVGGLLGFLGLADPAKTSPDDLEAVAAVKRPLLAILEKSRKKTAKALRRRQKTPKAA